MSDDPTSSGNFPRVTMASLLLAVFTVSIGFGIVLPLLPYLIERLLGKSVQAAQISRHTGLLTALYTLSLFLFAPLWGRLSDRRGARGVLLLGLVGFAATTLVFAFAESLTAVYAERFLSGVFAAAVTPVAAAVMGTISTTEQARARRLTFLSMAGIAGFLLGPMLGVLVSRFAARLFTSSMPAGSVAIPLAGTALLGLLVASAVAFAVPRSQSKKPSLEVVAPTDRGTWLVPKLLVLTFIVSAAVGVFEVGLALRGRQQLDLSAHHIALMYTECSVVMFAMQALVFAPQFKPAMTRWLIAPALSVLAAGLFILPWASDFTLMLGVIAAVASSAGVLSPILTYWISANASSAQGWELGKQTAVASLGLTGGAAAGGLLFNVAVLPGASFFLAALLTALGFSLSLRLPQLLVPPRTRTRVANHGY